MRFAGVRDWWQGLEQRYPTGAALVSYWGVAILLSLAALIVALCLRPGESPPPKPLGEIPYAYGQDLVERITGVMRGHPTLGLLAGDFRPFAYQISSRRQDRAAACTISVAAIGLLLAMPLCVMCLAASKATHETRVPARWSLLWAVLGVLVVGWLIADCQWLPLAVITLAALGYLFRMSRSGRPVLVTPVRAPVRVLCYAQLVVGLILAALLLVLLMFYDGWYPRLESARGSAFERFSPELIVTRSKVLPAEREVESLAEMVGQLPSLHHLFSARGADNPFGWSYLLACLYILLAVFILVMCLLRPGFQKARLHQRLLMILVWYFAVGFAFGILYHLLYVGEIGKYNSFLARYFEEKAWQVEHGQEPYVGDPRGVIGLSRSRIASLTVFAQDKPQFRQDAAQLDESEPFQATFLFDSGSHDLEPNRQFKLNEAGAVPTNAQEKGRFQDFVNDLARQPYPRGSPRYRVRIVGGADRRPYPRGRPDAAEGNEFLAINRAKQMRDRLADWLGEVAAQPAASSQAPALRTAIAEAILTEYTIQPKEQSEDADVIRKLQTLWPNGMCSGGNEELDQACWRAASVTIWPQRPDPAATRALLGPAESTLEDMIYFSFVSFTTTGYGDIKPVSNEARWWVIIENVLEVFITGLFFATVLGLGRDRTPASGGAPLEPVE